MSEPKRILVFELNWLGDILFSFPFLRAVRSAFPEAYIACVVVPRYADLLINNPWINDVRALSDNNSITSIGEKIAFVHMIRKERYDTCFFLKPSRIKTIMAELAGISERIGFKGKKATLTKEVEVPEGELHRADVLLSLAGAVGVTHADGNYEYFLSEEDGEHAAELIRKAGGGTLRTVAINPGGNWEAKRWPVEKFIQLSKKLLDRFSDIEVMVTGAEKDIDLAKEIVSGVASPRCFTVAGRTRLNQLAAMFKKCALVISADSGPLHLASAVGASTIALFGPTTHKITGPRGKGENIIISKYSGCEIPCYVEECDKDYFCMRSIEVDEVFSAALKVLANEG